MPEQITKYPDVTMQVLQSAGARCAEGIEPNILTQCPEERFCRMPGGEVCIYGIGQIPQMTQIKPADLAPMVCSEEAGGGATLGGAGSFEALVLGGAFVAGLALGRVGKRPRGG